MSITAQLADGTQLQFPDGTDPAVIQRVVKQQMASKAPDHAPLAQAIAAAGLPPDAPSGEQQFGASLKAGFQGIHNGMLMGFGDNMNGALGAVLSDPTAPDYLSGMGARYAGNRDYYRQQYADNQAQHPAALAAGNIGGAVLGAIPSLPYATGKTLMGTMARGAAMGAAQGGISGAGYADGQDVVNQAGQGALLGGTLGAALPAAIAGVRAVAADPITGIIDSLANRANQGKAARAIGDAARAAKMGPAEIEAAMAAAAADGQLEFRAMDALGLPGQRAASGIARSGGDAGAEIAKYLESRQIGQGNRVSDFVHDAFGFNGKGSGQTLPMDPRRPVPLAPAQILSGKQVSAAQASAKLTTARSEAANLAYDAARKNAAPVDVQGALGVIDARTSGMAGSGIAGDGIDAKLMGYRSRLAGDGKGLGPDVTGAQLSDFNRVLGVKQAVQDDIGAAVRAGRNNEARELGKLVTELDASLEASSPAYRQANDGFRAASQNIGAIDTGAEMASRGRAADNVPAFQAMTPNQQQAARIGYGDNLLNSLERNPALTANKAKPLILSQKRADEAAAIALQPDLYASRLARENTMWETQNRALGGSRTADNQRDIGQLAGQALGAAKAVASLNVGDAVSKIVGLLAPLAKGQNEATRALIAKALMAGDASALTPLINKAASGQDRARLIELLMRDTGQQGLQQ